MLDHQLIDSEGRRCGKVDDIGLEGGPGEPLEVVALFSGRRRGRRVRIPWDEVKEIKAHVVLKKPASAYGLGRSDDRLRPSLEKIPGSDR